MKDAASGSGPFVCRGGATESGETSEDGLFGAFWNLWSTKSRELSGLSL